MERLKIKKLILKIILLLTVYKQYIFTSVTWNLTAACAPHLHKEMVKSLHWALFGKSDYDAVDKVNDKEAERRSHWTTISLTPSQQLPPRPKKTDWLEKHKYALELHNVTTIDGYQLLLHRIPKSGKQPVLLVHGLLTSSLAWVLLGPEKSLAFLLADRNYDVWLANLRGSPYARSHTQLSVHSADYWSFSFHEMGAYDLPAIMDHIRMESSYEQLLLIGHSQALNAFLVLCSIHPEYNGRILLMQALAPIVALRDFVRFKSDDVRRVMRFVKSKVKSESHELFPAGYLRKKCLKHNSVGRKECLSIMKSFAGNGSHAKSMDPLIYGQLIQGGSLKEIKHLQQIWLSGDFVAFDYGVEGNRKYYNNSVEPHNYDLSLVSAPLILYYGESDAIATPEGVHNIYSRLLNASVIGVYRINAMKFNHLDFLCAHDVKKLVNDRVIDMLEQHLAGKLPYVIE